jgi:cell division protein FtsL
MRFKIFTFIAAAFTLLISCNSNTGSSTESTSEDIEFDLPKSEVEFPSLSDDAMDKITSWQYFQEFENDLKQINRGNVRSYRSETERMSIVADSLLKNIPEDLNTNAISSRMRVVNVRIKLLEESIHQPNAELDDITNHLKETNNAFTNLIIQLNEKFEKMRIDELARTLENLEHSESARASDSQ